MLALYLGSYSWFLLKSIKLILCVCAVMGFSLKNFTNTDTEVIDSQQEPYRLIRGLRDSCLLLEVSYSNQQENVSRVCVLCPLQRGWDCHFVQQTSH